jgi:hypothetical protein
VTSRALRLTAFLYENIANGVEAIHDVIGFVEQLDGLTDEEAAFLDDSLRLLLRPGNVHRHAWRRRHGCVGISLEERH